MIFTCAPENEKRDGVDYCDVKAWFQQCRDGQKAVEAQRAKIAQIRLLAGHITPSMTGMPLAPGNGDKVGEGAANIVDERRRLQRMETDLCNLRMEATRRAYCLYELPECAKTICEYYVNGKTQTVIAQESGFLDTRVIRSQIKRGLITLAEIWDSIDKNAQK